MNFIHRFLRSSETVVSIFLFEKNIKLYAYDDIPIKINFSLLLYILIAIGFAIIPAFINEGEGKYYN